MMEKNVSGILSWYKKENIFNFGSQHFIFADGVSALERKSKRIGPCWSRPHPYSYAANQQHIKI